MAGIQISGLLSNSAFDWKTIVSELIAADSVPITNLKAEQTTNSSQVTALGSLQADLTSLQTSLENLRSGDLFAARTVSSSNSNSTWQSTSANGATLGAYTFAVQHLATQAQTQGATGVGSGLNATGTVTGLTIANLNVATPITAGTFTVNGQQVTVATTDSLQDVFNKIAAGTGGDVTGAYSPGGSVPVSDGITLTSGGGHEVLLGANNDTSNFLSVMKLANNGTPSTSSSAPLGTVELSAPIASAHLSTALTGLDLSGNGSVTINGVTINYNANTDTVSTLLSRINQSGAGVSITYDSANNRFNAINNNTGDVGMGLADTTGTLLASMGLTAASGGTFSHGQNAQFTVNNGPPLSSASNTLDSAVTGISGFSVTVNSQTTETLQIQSNTSSMQSAIQDMISKFNTVQTDIQNDTQITSSGGQVTTSVLSSNQEVASWASDLKNMAFDAVTGVTGSIQNLDNLGIGFTGTSGQLSVIDSTKLADALANNPQDVQNFFLTGNTGFVGRMYGGLIKQLGENTNEQGNLTKANTDIGTHITTLQNHLNDEQTQLTNAFISMLDAQSKAQSEGTTLTNAFFQNSSSSSSSSSCWIARAVYGARNPRWLVFRFWLLQLAPAWFRGLYLRHGERFASWLDDKPRVRHLIRRWMDARIDRLLHT